MTISSTQYVRNPGADIRVVGSLTALNDTVEVDTTAAGSVSVQIDNAFVGTVVFEVAGNVTATGGPSFTAVNAISVGTSPSAVASATAAGLWVVPISGEQRFRVRFSAYTSGTPAVTLVASQAPISNAFTAVRSQSLVTATLSVPSTASTTTIGTAFSVPLKYDSLLVIASLAGVTGGTLDVYLQDSPDNGTTWVDCAHFPQVAAGGTVKCAFALALSPTPVTVGIGTLGTPGVALAAGAVRSAPWVTSTMRIVAVTSGGTSGATQVQTIYFIPTDYAE